MEACLAWRLGRVAGLCAVIAIAGCVSFPGQPTSRDKAFQAPPGFHQIGLRDIPPPMPLRVPIKGVMAGVIDFSAHGVFVTATSEEPLKKEDWLAAGLASINLIGASSLITLPGTGPHDADWVAEPSYRHWAEAMQAASTSAGAATARKDRIGLLDAANRLATVCQSCHDMFRPDIPSAASQFAAREAPGRR